MTGRWLGEATVRGSLAMASAHAPEDDLLCWPGALRALPMVTAVSAARRIILITGDRSYRQSGAAQMLAEVLPTSAEVMRIDALAHDATADELREAVEGLRRRSPSLLLAVGGGRVIDQAKVLRVLAAQGASPADVLAGEAPIRRRGNPLFAIPTAPAGAEVTPLASIRIDGRRAGLDHPYLRPDLALVDARLSASLTAPLTARCAVQVLGEAIDTLWSVGAHAASRRHAQQALEGALGGLTALASGGALDARARASLAEAALHGGLARQDTRGALLHALAVPLAEALQVPLGEAISVLLPQALRLNGRFRALPSGERIDRNAIDQALATIVRALGCCSAESAAVRLRALLNALALPTRCGPSHLSDRLLDAVVDSVNLACLRHNPVQPTRAQLVQILQRVRCA